MRQFKIIASLVLILIMAAKANCQVTAITDVPHTPVTSAVLDVYSTTRGMLIPRLTIAQRNSISTPATGLLIYQLVTSPGFYYYNGTLWLPFIVGNGWLLGGNTLASIQTIGTISNHDLPFITNNTEKMRLTSWGGLGIGSTAFDATYPELLLVDYENTTSHTLANFRGSVNNFMRLEIKNTKPGKDASSDFVATADNGDSSSFYIDMGMNSSAYLPSIDNFGNANDGYLFTDARHLLIGTATPNMDINFLVGGGQMAVNKAMEIEGSTKNIVIGKQDGTSTPAGNIIRGPNAVGGNNNGGDLILQGGAAVGTGTGGNLNLNGGGIVSGTGGPVNINASVNYRTFINTGTNNKNVTIGNANNDIMLPNWNAVGAVYYNSNNSGQLDNSQMFTWDNPNTELGVGTSSPSITLHISKVTGTGTARYDVAIVEERNATAGSNSNLPTFTLLRQFPTTTYPSGANHQGGIFSYGHRNTGSAFLDVAQFSASTKNADSYVFFSTCTGMTNGNPAGGILNENAWIQGDFLHCENLNGGATTLSCDATGNIIRTPSDAKLKRDVATITNALDKVMALRGVNYDWLNKDKYGSQRQIGFIAQELEKVVPEAVSSGGEYKSVNYQLLTAVLTEAIKEQQKIIDDLESQLAEPDMLLDKLEEKVKNIHNTVASSKKSID